MILLSTIINQFEQGYLAKYNSAVLPEHKKALQAMKQCRKEHGPHMLAWCTDHKCDESGRVGKLYLPTVTMNRVGKVKICPPYQTRSYGK